MSDILGIDAVNLCSDIGFLVVSAAKVEALERERDAWKAKAEALSTSTLTPEERAWLKTHYAFTDAELNGAQLVRHKDGRLASLALPQSAVDCPSPGA